MVIDWHSEDNGLPPGELVFRSAGRREWQLAGRPEALPFPHSSRRVYRTELKGLEPDTRYQFRIMPQGVLREFRTLPNVLDRPVRFLIGGDMMQERGWMEQTARIGMQFDPDFVIAAGDLAYADGLSHRVDRWYDYFEAYARAFRAPDGRMVPMLHAPGNHEVTVRYWFRDDDYQATDDYRARIAPYFLGLLAFPGQPGYGVIDVGEYLSLILLDSDHINPIDGAQKAWLEETLSARADRPHVFPVYHVPAYPSVRPFNGEVSERVRMHWVPLFEQFGIQTVFEAHDHAYKRTLPMRGGQEHPSGIVFIGDGAWGVEPREIGMWNRGEVPWYLARSASVRHAMVVTIAGNHHQVLAFDEHGSVIDQHHSTSATTSRPPALAATLGENY